MTRRAGPRHAAPRRGPRWGRAIVRGFGELLITLGVVVLLFVGYELYVTNWFSAQEQADATAQLDRQWSNPRAERPHAPGGQGIAKLYIPSFGTDWVFTVVEGTDAASLEIGPGHYTDTAMPGEPGNFSVAGHRVGRGAPFNDIDQLASCDAIVIETATDWFVYRVLPLDGEAASWAEGQGAQERCADVHPMPEPFSEVVGQRIVLPSQDEVIAPVPGRKDLQPPADQQATLITLTTCHPQFSARERLIVHGVLVTNYPKGDGRQRPAELTEG